MRPMPGQVISQAPPDYPAESNVKKDITYDYDDRTGTYDPEGAPSPPTKPTLSVAQLTETSVRATVDGDADVTNYLLYQSQSDDDWNAGGDRSGDGTLDVTSLTEGVTYYFVCYSTDGTIYSLPSAMQKLSLLNTSADPLEALRTLIMSKTSITDIVSTRMYPHILPQPSQRPAIVYNRISTTIDHIMSGRSQYETARVQLSCWGTTYEQANDLADLLISEISGSAPTVGSFEFHRIMCDGMVDDTFVDPKTHQEIYGINLDFELDYYVS